MKLPGGLKGKRKSRKFTVVVFTEAFTETRQTNRDISDSKYRR